MVNTTTNLADDDILKRARLRLGNVFHRNFEMGLHSTPWVLSPICLREPDILATLKADIVRQFRPFSRRCYLLLLNLLHKIPLKTITWSDEYGDSKRSLPTPALHLHSSEAARSAVIL